MGRSVVDVSYVILFWRRCSLHCYMSIYIIEVFSSAVRNFFITRPS